MAYAIINSGGKQFKVTEGEIVHIPSIAAEVGAAVELEALAKGDGESLEIGTPALAGHITATVVAHGRDKKVIVFKKKRRKQYKKTHGHRQNYTAVRIDSI